MNLLNIVLIGGIAYIVIQQANKTHLIMDDKRPVVERPVFKKKPVRVPDNFKLLPHDMTYYKHNFQAPPPFIGGWSSTYHNLY